MQDEAQKPRPSGWGAVTETSAIKYKIDTLIGIHSRDGYETAALLTPDDLAEIRDRIAAVEAENARLRCALVPFADVCAAEHMKYVRDEQVLEIVTRTDVIVSEKLRGCHFRGARAALAPAPAEEA